MTQTTNYVTTTNITNPNWIFLNTCSTISYVRNNIVKNIQPCDTGEELRAYTTGVHQYYNNTTTFNMLPFEVFFNEQSLTNIISFAAVTSKFSITINTQLNPCINVHIHNATNIIFKQFGVFYIILTQPTRPFTNNKS